MLPPTIMQMMAFIQIGKSSMAMLPFMLCSVRSAAVRSQKTRKVDCKKLAGQRLGGGCQR
jgi:hypothetical protein